MSRSRSSFRIGTSRMAALLAVFFFVALAAMVHQPAVASRSAGRSLAAPSARVMENFARLPLAFEANRGQLKAGVNYRARGAGFEAFLDRAGATLVMGSPALAPRSANNNRARTQPARTRMSQIRMKLAGASNASRPQAEDRLPGVANYYRG